MYTIILLPDQYDYEAVLDWDSERWIPDTPEKLYRIHFWLKPPTEYVMEVCRTFFPLFQELPSSLGDLIDNAKTPKR